jgi:sugar lactone lactonase YvrE
MPCQHLHCETGDHDPGEFETPHALARDSRGRLFVGDRGNNRVQIFDRDGIFLEQWTQFGRPSGMYIDGNDMLYVTDSSSSPRNNPGFGRGIRIGSVADGMVVTFIDDPDANGIQEGVIADAAGHVYGSLTGGTALRKYTRK